MLEPAADLGSALCRSFDALGLVAPSACGDPSGIVTIGCLLLLSVGAGLCALFVSERLTVSDFVRKAIEERTARRSLTLSRDPPARDISSAAEAADRETARLAGVSLPEPTLVTKNGMSAAPLGEV